MRILTGLAWSETIALLLTAVHGRDPGRALPATFTLAAAVGALDRSPREASFPLRLSAVDEAATMDVLCSDKTGTLTRNELAVGNVRPMSGFDEAHVLTLATLASADGGQDPVDAAIRAAAKLKPEPNPPSADLIGPLRSREGQSSEASCDGRAMGGICRSVRRWPMGTIIAQAQPSPAGSAAVDELEKQGFRVLAVAAGQDAQPLQLVGLISLSDPPRSDSPTPDRRAKGPSESGPSW